MQLQQRKTSFIPSEQRFWLTWAECTGKSRCLVFLELFPLATYVSFTQTQKNNIYSTEPLQSDTVSGTFSTVPVPSFTKLVGHFF